MDVLLVTGPMNARQLGVPERADYAVVHVHPLGDDIGSDAMYRSMSSFLDGADLRSRLSQVWGRRLGNVGVSWFSAGHGAVRALLDAGTQPADVTAWLCIDGLYGDNRWATRLAKAAAEGETHLMATASTSTPGHYDHSLDRWRDAMQTAGIPSSCPRDATLWGLPEPDVLWADGNVLVAGYEHLGHAQQVPAVRESMLRFWDAARAPSSGINTARVVAFLVAAAIGVGVGWRVASKTDRRKREV